jgi:hypothetical protein
MVIFEERAPKRMITADLMDSQIKNVICEIATPHAIARGYSMGFAMTTASWVLRLSIFAEQLRS